MKWEYTILIAQDCKTDAKTLNAMGVEGWELVWIGRCDDGLGHVFKRPKQEVST